MRLYYSTTLADDKSSSSQIGTSLELIILLSMREHYQRIPDFFRRLFSGSIVADNVVLNRIIAGLEL